MKYSYLLISYRLNVLRIFSLPTKIYLRKMFNLPQNPKINKKIFKSNKAIDILRILKSILAHCTSYQYIIQDFEKFFQHHKVFKQKIKLIHILGHYGIENNPLFSDHYSMFMILYLFYFPWISGENE